MKKLFLFGIFWILALCATAQVRIGFYPQTDLGYYDIAPQYQSYAWPQPTYQLLRNNPRLVTGRFSMSGDFAFNSYDAYTAPQLDLYYSNPFRRVYTQPGPYYQYGYDYPQVMIRQPYMTTQFDMFYRNQFNGFYNQSGSYYQSGYVYPQMIRQPYAYNTMMPRYGMPMQRPTIMASLCRYHRCYDYCRPIYR